MKIDIVGYLESKNIKVYRGSNNNIHFPCPFHGEDPNDRGKLYLLADPDSERFGSWICFRCEERGGINKLRQHFGDEPIRNVSPTATSDDLPDDTQMAILTAAAKFYHESLVENLDAVKYLREERGLTIDTIRKHKLGWGVPGLVTHLISKGFDAEDIKKTSLVAEYGEFLEGMITIPYHLMGQVVQIRGKEIGAKYKTLPGYSAQLFNADAAIEANVVVVCEGEFDCMVMEQFGFAAVGVPGVSTWKDGWTNSLSEAKRIFIVYDNDHAGRAAAEKLSSKLGGKSRIVEMPEALPGQPIIDVSEWVTRYNKGKEDFQYLFSKSVGGLLVTVRQSFERWLEVEGNPNLSGLHFNIEQIDQRLHLGLLPGNVFVLIAKTNSGKTIFSLNLFERMSQIKPEIKILFLSLEQTRNEWFERALRIHSFYIDDDDESKTIDYWDNRFYIVDKNRLSQEDVISCIQQFEYELGTVPDLVCIDYLGYYSRGMKGKDTYEKMTEAVMGLKEVAKETQTVIYTPAQVNRQGAFGKELSADMAKDSSAIEHTADFIMSLWAPDQQPGKRPEDHEGVVMSQILKSRGSGVGYEVPFQFAPLTLAMVPRGDPLVEKARREREWANLGETWRQAVERHRTGDYNAFRFLESR